MRPAAYKRDLIGSYCLVKMMFCAVVNIKVNIKHYTTAIVFIMKTMAVVSLIVMVHYCSRSVMDKDTCALPPFMLIS